MPQRLQRFQDGFLVGLFLPPGRIRALEGFPKGGDAKEVLKDGPAFGLRGMGRQHRLDVEGGQGLSDGTRRKAPPAKVLKKILEGHGFGMVRVLFVGQDPAHAVIFLRDVDELKIEREGPGQFVGLFRPQLLDDAGEGPSLAGAVIAPDLTAKNADALHRGEKSAALPLVDDLAQPCGERAHAPANVVIHKALSCPMGFGSGGAGGSAG